MKSKSTKLWPPEHLNRWPHKNIRIVHLENGLQATILDEDDPSNKRLYIERIWFDPLGSSELLTGEALIYRVDDAGGLVRTEDGEDVLRDLYQVTIKLGPKPE